MKCIYRPLLFLSLVLTGTSCAHYEDRLKSSLDPWLNQAPDHLVELWGAPSSSYVMKDGAKVLSYFNDRTVTRSQGMGYASWRWGTYSYTLDCKINFFTDAANSKIERYTTTGEVGSCNEALLTLPKP